MGQTDRCIRAMTNDGAYRVIAIDSTETAQGVISAQGATGNAAVLLGELVTASVLVREMMSPGMRLQAILGTNPQRFSIVADSRPGGLTRGLINLPEEGEVGLGEGVYLQVSRVLYNGELHQGFVATDAQHGLAGSLSSYMMRSEQTASLVDLACVMDEAGKVVSAGGYIVQLLPEADEAAIALMTVRAEHFESVRSLLEAGEGSPESLLEALLEHFPYTILETSPVSFGCECSQARVLAAMATMTRKEIEELVSGGEVLDIGCDYCGTVYHIGAEQLKTLLTSN